MTWTTWALAMGLAGWQLVVTLVAALVFPPGVKDDQFFTVTFASGIIVLILGFTAVSLG